MKLENTLENKARFFALYWNLNIGKCKSYHRNVITRISADTIDIIDYLELTPLSLITDEDINEVIRIFDAVDKSISENGCREATYEEVKRDIEALTILDYISGYLRSKGYAVPWMGMSVDDLVSYGWVKIKEA